MAKYRALASLYVGSRLIAPGDVFQSDDVPGTKWEPLDDEGKSAYERKHAKPEVAKAALAKAEPEAVSIPENWEDMNPEQRINLARQLGAPAKGTKAADADKVIKAEVEKRAEAKAAADQKDA
jgi:hypothetical protein